MVEWLLPTSATVLWVTCPVRLCLLVAVRVTALVLGTVTVVALVLLLGKRLNTVPSLSI